MEATASIKASSAIVALEAVPSSWVAGRIVVALEVVRQSAAVKEEDLRIAVVGVVAASFAEVEAGDQKLEAM